MVAKLLPLDPGRREEARVWLAFIARAAVDPELAPQGEDIWRRLHVPFVHYIDMAVRHGELPRDLDVEQEATQFQALVDGLVVHLVTAPHHAPGQLALAVVDDHLAALRSERHKLPA